MAAEGAAVIAADINDCSETVASIATAGGRAVAAKVDVSDAES
jgi:NAD(P)-dependent dehydrogenase (short-subunit alcohol dehydrogenase family)